MGLPFKPFLYTLDQISDLLSIPLNTLKSQHLFYQSRSLGHRQYNKIETVNLSPDGEKPEWRVSEVELIRWLRFKGFRVYDRVQMRASR